MLAAVDIETSCGVPTCQGYGESNSSRCDHAVFFKTNRIEIIGVFDEHGKYHCFRDVRSFDEFKDANKLEIIGHNFKFDYKSLKYHGSTIKPKDVVGDTQLLGSVVSRKVTNDFLIDYNNRRKALNAELPPKIRHRSGTPLSLKTMAPFYLGVPSFWENPTDHNDENYNALDCEYTFYLHEELYRMAEDDKTLPFYEEKLLPWSKLIAEAEFEGVLIDVDRLHKMYAEAVRQTATLEEAVHDLARAAFKAYRSELARELTVDSEARCAAYLATRLKDKNKADAVKERYALALAEKVKGLPTKFNLNSPSQVKALLEYHAVDMTVEKRDKETNEWIEKEGTDKFVLTRAKVLHESKLADALLKFRQKETEVTYLQQYIEAVSDGEDGPRIHCTFNPTGTRTGRLSSAGPNLQNVKGALRVPFLVADPNKHTIYTVDASQIEPRVIAFYTQDEELVKLFKEGRDFHNYATKKFFPDQTRNVLESDIKKSHADLRKTAKIGDLSILYGTGAHTFSTMCLVREGLALSPEQSSHMVRTFREGMSHVQAWKRALEDRYKNGQPILSYMGRLVQARDLGSVHMTLFNSLVQGTASDMILHASLRAFRYFCKVKIDAKPLLWVHDEVVWRFPKDEKEAEFCRNAVDYFMKDYSLTTAHGKVPLDVEGHIGDKWQK